MLLMQKIKSVKRKWIWLFYIENEDGCAGGRFHLSWRKEFFNKDDCSHWERVALSLLGGLTEAGCPTLSQSPSCSGQEDKALWNDL